MLCVILVDLWLSVNGNYSNGEWQVVRDSAKSIHTSQMTRGTFGVCHSQIESQQYCPKHPQRKTSQHQKPSQQQTCPPQMKNDTASPLHTPLCEFIWQQGAFQQWLFVLPAFVCSGVLQPICALSEIIQLNISGEGKYNTKLLPCGNVLHASQLLSICLCVPHGFVKTQCTVTPLHLENLHSYW